MANEKFQYIKNFFEKYSKELEEKFSVDNNINEFSKFEEEIKKVYSTIKSISEMSGDHSFEKFEEYLNNEIKNFNNLLDKNPNVDLKLKNVSDIYKDFYSKLSDEEKEKASLGKDGFEKDLAIVRAELHRIYKISNYYEKRFDVIDKEKLQDEVYNAVLEGKSKDDIKDYVSSQIYLENIETNENFENVIDDETLTQKDSEDIDKTSNEQVEQKDTEDIENEPQVNDNDAEELEEVIGSGDEISQNDEWEKAYLVINDKINSIEQNINNIINEYSKKCTRKLTLEPGNIGKNANVVLMFLEDENKQEFVDAINGELSNTKKVKEEIAYEYIKITEDGIKKLRELRKNLNEIIEQKEEIDRDIEQREKDLNDKQDKLDALKSSLDNSKDNSDILAQIVELEEEINTISSSIENLKRKSSDFQIQIENEKESFEKSQNGYLEAADKVRAILEAKGVNITLKSQNLDKEEVTSSQQQTTVNSTPVSSQPVQNVVAEQVTQKNNNLPSTNLDPREKFKNDYKNVINGARNVDTMLSSEEYNKILASFDGIINSPFKLTQAEKRELKEIFDQDKEQILSKLKESNLGKDDSLIEELLSSEEINSDTQNAIVKSVNSYLEKIKDGKITEDEIKEYEKNVAGPMKFAYLEQCAQIAGKYGGKKFLGIIPTGRKKVDCYLETINSSLKEVDKYLEQIKKVESEQKTSNEPTIESQQITNEEKKEVKNQPKSFKEMLGGLINSNDEINLKDGLNIKTEAEKINWNKRNLPKKDNVAR